VLRNGADKFAGDHKSHYEDQSENVGKSIVEEMLLRPE
jgi:hypothetical protein